jgi:hypothetical protein
VLQYADMSGTPAEPPMWPERRRAPQQRTEIRHGVGTHRVVARYWATGAECRRAFHGHAGSRVEVRIRPQQWRRCTVRTDRCRDGSRDPGP